MKHLRQSRRPKRLSVFFAMAFGTVSSVPNARAHHTSATTRVNSGAGFSQSYALSSVRSESFKLPRIDPSLGYAYQHFGRLLEGTSERGAGSGRGAFSGLAGESDKEIASPKSVSMHWMVPSLDLRLPSQARFSLQLPFGYQSLSRQDSSSDSAFGLGDLTLLASQELLSRFRGDDDLRDTRQRYALHVLTGLVAPTGRYSPDTFGSVTEIEGGAGGQLNQVTYNAQASLGADVWSVILGSSFEARVHQSTGLEVLIQSVTPVSQTSDGIRWGTDLDVVAGGRFYFLEDRLMLHTAFGYRHHSRDSVPLLDETTGAVSRTKAGGRHELAARAGIDGVILERLYCGVFGRVPVWQKVRGIQLVETVATGMNCTVPFSL